VYTIADYKNKHYRYTMSEYAVEIERIRKNNPEKLTQSAAARKLAEKEEIEIRLYSIIYDAINDIKDAIEGMLEPVMKEEIVASVEVMEIFRISKVGTVAGCVVREGKLQRSTPGRSPSRA